jgi:hypothetical protein
VSPLDLYVALSKGATTPNFYYYIRFQAHFYRAVCFCYTTGQCKSFRQCEQL